MLLIAHKLAYFRATTFLRSYPRCYQTSHRLLTCHLPRASPACQPIGTLSLVLPVCSERPLRKILVLACGTAHFHGLLSATNHPSFPDGFVCRTYPFVGLSNGIIGTATMSFLYSFIARFVSLLDSETPVPRVLSAYHDFF